MRFLYNTSKLFSFKKGQAVVEYILVLVVCITIAYTLLEMFSKPFRTFTEGLFGEDSYYSCLYEVGALPGMACDSEYPDFQTGTFDPQQLGLSSSGSFTPSNFNSNPSGGGDGSPRGSFPVASSNSSNTSTNTSPAVSEWGTGAYTGSPNFSSSRNGRAGASQSFLAQSSFDSNSFRNRRGRNSSRGKVKTKFNIPGEEDDSSSSGYRSTPRKGFIASEGRLQDEEENPQGVTSATSQITKESPQNRGKRIEVQKKAKTQNLDQDDEPFTFGKFIKYVLIIVIVLTILFFIVVRTMEISENLKAA